MSLPTSSSSSSTSSHQQQQDSSFHSSSSYSIPWSKRHKTTFKNAKYNLSNSFAQPLTNQELIDLSIQRNDHEIVNEYYHHSLVYTPNGGSLDLRTEIANLYGSNITAEHILIFPGAQVALQTAAIAVFASTASATATKATTSTSCHAIVFTPGYQSVQEAPEQAGMDVTTIALQPENNWQIPIDKVIEAIQDNTRYIVINVPHNPTGTVMEKSIQQQLITLCSERNIYLMSDEVYRLLEHDIDDDKERLPAMADTYSKGLSCVTLSKPWGGCGITIGWIACQDKYFLQNYVSNVQYYGTACPSRASEIQAIMVLRSSSIILEKNIQIIKHNKQLIEEFITTYSQYFEWITPTAGAIGFLKFNGPFNSDQLGEQLATVGISIKPAYVFAKSKHMNTSIMCQDYESYFRIGFGEKCMPQALQALSQFVIDHQSEWGKGVGMTTTKKERIET